MILAIDCGSTNHKAALFDRDLRRISTASLPLKYSVRTPDRAEFDPEQYWQDTVKLIRQVCAGAGITPGSIETISITSQAQTFTALDAPGRALCPFLSWSDKRARTESVDLTDRLGAAFHHHCSFPTPYPQLQISKLLWLSRQLPGGLPAQARIVSAPGYLAMRLAGLHCTDTNLAAMSGLFSLKQNGWWEEALSACSIEPRNCGMLVPVGTGVDASAPCLDLEFQRRLKIVFAGNDQTAGAVANASASGGLIVTLGTALVAYRFGGEARGPFNPEGCWGPYPQGGYYELLTRDEGCSALDWAVSELTHGNEVEFFQMAERGRRGASQFDPGKMGSLDAWSVQASPEDMALAVLEGICFSLRELVEKLAPKQQYNSVAVIGGGSASDFWLQLLGDILKREVRRGTGDNLLGAAMMAVGTKSHG